MDKNAKFKMIETVERGQMNAGWTFGHVDVPKVITEKHRPFLNELTAASLPCKKKSERNYTQKPGMLKYRVNMEI